MTASASEQKKDTTYAVDINGSYLDHGIGRFICRTTDSTCPKEIKEKNTNYFVFEYIQNDEDKPSYDKYAIVNLSTLPEFIKSDILDPEIMEHLPMRISDPVGLREQLLANAAVFLKEIS